MTRTLLSCLWVDFGRMAWALLVGLFCVGGLASSALAQVPDDTARVDTARGESLQPPRAADLDTLRTDVLAPPFDPERERPAADTGGTERAYVNADSLSALERDGESLQELFGNVYVRQDTTRLFSEYALRYLDRNELLFVDNVVIYERGDTLQADTVRYNRDTKVGRARGNVRLTDGDVVVNAPRATYFGEEKRSVFPDSITLVDSNRVLRAQEGTYWSDEQRAEFGGLVRLTDPNTYLEADSLTYFRDRERSIARGNVFIDRRGEEEASADTTTQTYLFGDRADNREKHRYSQVEGQAVLVQVRRDSAGTPEDTLVVQAHRLEAFRTDTHRRLVAVDSVEIWQPDLSAVADSAVYDRVMGSTSDTTEGAAVAIDTTRPPADSISALASADPPPSSDEPSTASDLEEEETRDEPPSVSPDTSDSDTETPVPPDTLAQADTSEAPPDSTAPADRRPSSGTETAADNWDTPSVQDEDELPVEETRLFRSPETWFEESQVWGDSIRVRARERSLDTVFVRGSAFAAQRDTAVDRINQLKGRNITAFFRSDSLRRIVARPNGEAIRFVANDRGALDGGLRTSADRIVLRFEKGEVKRTSVIGGVQSSYYRTPEDIPEPFELEGFRWTPERRPTRARLLQDERVRQKLDLDTIPPPPVARRQEGGLSTHSSGGRGTSSSSESLTPDFGLDHRRGTPADTTSEAVLHSSPSGVPSDSVSIDPSVLFDPNPGRHLLPSDTSETRNDSNE